jgi:hypothetical protein
LVIIRCTVHGGPIMRRTSPEGQRGKMSRYFSAGVLATCTTAVSPCSIASFPVPDLTLSPVGADLSRSSDFAASLSVCRCTGLLSRLAPKASHQDPYYKSCIACLLQVPKFVRFDPGCSRGGLRHSSRILRVRKRRRLVCYRFLYR